MPTTSTPTKLSRSFGQVLREARNTAGITQEALGARANVHRTYIGDLESGRKSPTLDVIVALARALGLTGQELMGAVEKREEAVGRG